MYDLIKLQRIFNFIRISFNACLEEYAANDPGIIVRSLVPVFSKSYLESLLTKFVSNSKATNFIKAMAWHAGTYVFLDLQYKPIIGIGNYYIFPLNIYGESNAIRNMLSSQKVRLFHDGTLLPMETLLSKTLRNHFRFVEISVSIISGEIDVIALSGQHLFIFECKNAILPGNIFELRTSYDYILKANNQLNKIEKYLSGTENLINLMNRLKWPIPLNPIVTFCIVTGNRLFWGYKGTTYPIHPIHEIRNYLIDGTVILGKKRYSIRNNSDPIEDQFSFSRKLQIGVKNMLQKALFSPILLGN